MELTVIIPTFNRNEWVVRCLKTLTPEMQGLKKEQFEVIVADDNPDNQLERHINCEFPNVIVVKGPQRGPAANRNKGASISKGNLLVFIDDDCIATENLLQVYLNASYYSTFGAFEGKTIADRKRTRYDEEAPINLKGGNFWSCNIAIRKSIFLEVNGFDEGFPFPAMEDVDFHIRIKKVTNVNFLPEAIVVHPYRKVKPFLSYTKWIESHKYILNKNRQSLTFGFRLERLKLFLGILIGEFKILHKYKYKGVGFYFEKLLFYFKMIFI